MFKGGSHTERIVFFPVIRSLRLTFRWPGIPDANCAIIEQSDSMLVPMVLHLPTQ